MNTSIFLTKIGMSEVCLQMTLASSHDWLTVCCNLNMNIPCCARSEAQLQYAILLYLLRRWEDAWLELGIWVERQKALSAASSPLLPDAEILLEKTRLQLVLGSKQS